MKSKKKLEKFICDKKEAGVFFLGVGITLFLLNITTMITSIQEMVRAGVAIDYPFFGFYVSIVTSCVLILYSVLNITETEK